MRYEWKLSEQALVHVLPGGGLHDLVANAGLRSHSNDHGNGDTYPLIVYRPLETIWMRKPGCPTLKNK